VLYNFSTKDILETSLVDRLAALRIVISHCIHFHYVMMIAVWSQAAFLSLVLLYQYIASR